MSPSLTFVPGVTQRPLVDGSVLVGTPELLEPVAVELGQLGQGLPRRALLHAGVHHDLVGGGAHDLPVATGGDHRAPSPWPPSPLEAPCPPRANRCTGAAPPASACSSPSGPGSRRRVPGRGSWPPPPIRAGRAPRRCSRSAPAVRAGKSPRRRHSTYSLLEMAVGRKRRVGLRDRGLLFLVRGQPGDLSRHPAVDHLAVRRFHEPQIVDPAIGGERSDQADVGSLRRLDGTHAAVVRIVHVADLEAPRARASVRPVPAPRAAACGSAPPAGSSGP